MRVCWKLRSLVCCHPPSSRSENLRRSPPPEGHIRSYKYYHLCHDRIAKIYPMVHHALSCPLSGSPDVANDDSANCLDIDQPVSSWVDKVQCPVLKRQIWVSDYCRRQLGDVVWTKMLRVVVVVFCKDTLKVLDWTKFQSLFWAEEDKIKDWQEP